MEEIKVNSKKLSYDKIVYVSKLNGSDQSGDGSKDFPFKTLLTAIKSTTNGDAVFLEPGVYRIDPIKPANSDNYSCGIYDFNKDIDIIGSSENTILEYIGSDATTRDSHAIVLENNSSRLINLTVSFAPGKETNYSNAIIRKTSGSFHNVVFEVKGNIPASQVYYDEDWDNYLDENPKFFNCLFYHSTGAIQADEAGLPKYINCVSNVGLINGVKETCKVIDFSLDNLKEMSTNKDLINKGTGEDPGGKQATIGIYGGEFAWILDKYFLLNDQGVIKTFDFGNNNWMNITTIDKLVDSDFINNGTTNLNIPVEYFETLNNPVVMTWFNDKSKSSANMRIKGMINALNYYKGDNIHIMTMTDNQDAEPQLKASGIVPGQLVLAKNDIDIKKVEEINYIKVDGRNDNESLIKVIVSKDSGNSWYTYKDGGFFTIEPNKKDVMLNGIDRKDLESIDNWNDFLGFSEKIRFGYYIDKLGIYDNLFVDSLEMSFDISGIWRKAIYEEEYDYSYKMTDNISVKLLTDGSYKLNY